MTTPTKRPRLATITTPVGIAIWPKLNAPDTKYKLEGEFGVKLKLTQEEAAPLIEMISAANAAKFEEVKKELLAGDGKSKAAAKALKYSDDLPYKADIDDEGDETDFVVFNFKMKHKIIREGKPDMLLYPDIFDSQGKAIKRAPPIWGGSQLRVSAQINPWYTAKFGVGVQLRLQAVQIIELSNGTARDAGGYGFGASEGGYQADADSDGSGFPEGDNADSGDQPANDDF